MKTGINKNPPHIHAADTSSAVIFDILAATVPAGVVALFFFGLRAFLIIIICVFSGVFFEILSNKILKKTDGNAFLPVIISGILFALIMPSSTPFWIVLAVCAGLAVLKHLYKIINYEIVNAVLLFRVLMSLVFGGFITPLLPFGSASLVGKPSYTEMFFGLQNGNMGEICVAVLILGGIYLCVRKVIFPSVPLAFIAAAAIMSVFFGRDPIREILSGGIFFAAVFFINDFETSPITKKGKIVFAVGAGVLTACFRTFLSNADGTFAAFLIMNLTVPLIDTYIKNSKTKNYINYTF